MAEQDAAKAEQAAALLFAAWQEQRQLPGLPAELVPQDAAQAYAVQAALMPRLGRIGGWKVGPGGPGNPPSCAPMPLGGLSASHAVLPASLWPAPQVEAEFCYRLGRDLPAAEAPFSRDAIIAAISSIHPGIELLQRRIAPRGASPLSLLADLAGHAGYVFGRGIPNWQLVDLTAETVALYFDGKEAKSATGYPFGDPLDLLLWLANEGSLWAGGLRAGEFITTGSWIGAVDMQNTQAAEIRFPSLGTVALRFAR